MKVSITTFAMALFLSFFTCYEVSSQTNKISFEQNPSNEGENAVLIVDPDFYSSGITITLTEVCGFAGCFTIENGEFTPKPQIMKTWRFPSVPSNGRCPLPTSKFNSGLFILYTQPNNSPDNLQSAENIRLTIN